MVMVMVVVMVVIIVIIMDGGMLLFMVVYIFTTLPILGTSSNFVHRLKSIHYLQKEYYSMVMIIIVVKVMVNVMVNDMDVFKFIYLVF